MEIFPWNTASSLGNSCPVFDLPHQKKLIMYFFFFTPSQKLGGHRAFKVIFCKPMYSCCTCYLFLLVHWSIQFISMCSEKRKHWYSSRNTLSSSCTTLRTVESNLQVWTWEMNCLFKQSSIKLSCINLIQMFFNNQYSWVLFLSPFISNRALPSPPPVLTPLSLAFTPPISSFPSTLPSQSSQISLYLISVLVFIFSFLLPSSLQISSIFISQSPSISCNCPNRLVNSSASPN